MFGRLSKERSLFMVMLVQLAANFRGGLVAPILSLFVRNQGLSLLQIGMIGTAGMLGWFVFEPLMGLVSDRWSKRWMLAGSFLLTSVIYAIYPMVHTFWFFVALEFLRSSFMSAYSIPIKALIAELLPSEGRGKTYGRYMTFIAFGGMISPLIGGYVSEIFGGQLPFYIAAGIGVIGTLIVFSIRAENLGQVEKNKSPKGWRTCLTGSVLAVFSVRGLLFFTAGFEGFLPIYLNESPSFNASESHIGAFYTFIRFASASGRSMIGELCDKLGNRRIMISSLVGLVLVYVLLFKGSGIIFLYSIGILKGLSSAAADTSMMLQLINVMSKDRSGLTMGLYSEAENIGGIISTPSVGYLYQAMGGGTALMFVAAMMLANAFLATLIIKEDWD